MRTTCSEDGCDKFCHGNGLCNGHYRLARRREFVRVDLRTVDGLADRFWKRVGDGSVPLGDPSLGPCRPFDSADGNGYGIIMMRDVAFKAHRVAYELTYGPIPGDLTLDHLCHTTDRTCPGGVTCPHRRCVEPTHLEAVTAEENTRRTKNRREKCVNGHYYDEAGYERWFDGGTRRVCSTCRPLVHPGRDPSKECPSGHDMQGDNAYTDARGYPLCRECRREAVRKYEAKSKAKIAAYHSERQQAAKAVRHAAVQQMVRAGTPIEDIAASLGTSVKGAKRTVTLASRVASTL